MRTTTDDSNAPHAADPSTDRLIGIRAVSDWIALSRTTVRRHVAAGIFPAPLVIGKVHRWRTSVVARWIHEREIAS